MCLAREQGRRFICFIGGTLSGAWPSVTKFDSESALRHTSQRCDTLSDRCVLLCSSRCASERQAAPTPLALLLPLCNAEGSDEMASRRSQSRACNGSSQQRGIDHEITNFHPVVSHLAGTPTLDRVPVDSICALARALDRSPQGMTVVIQ